MARSRHRGHGGWSDEEDRTLLALVSRQSAMAPTTTLAPRASSWQRCGEAALPPFFPADKSRCDTKCGPHNAARRKTGRFLQRLGLSLAGMLEAHEFPVQPGSVEDDPDHAECLSPVQCLVEGSAGASAVFLWECGTPESGTDWPRPTAARCQFGGPAVRRRSTA